MTGWDAFINGLRRELAHDEGRTEEVTDVGSAVPRGELVHRARVAEYSIQPQRR